MHVIGDSHACFFSGTESVADPWPQRPHDRIDVFRTYWLGPALAYHLPDLGTTTRAREKLLTILAFGPVEPRGLVMLSFGEIDCRFHLLRQAALQGRDVEAVVAECVERYLGVVREIRGYGFRPMVWNVVPSGRPVTREEENEEFPHWGSAGERNEATRLFNDAVAEALAADTPFVSSCEPAARTLALRDALHRPKDRSTTAAISALLRRDDRPLPHSEFLGHGGRDCSPWPSALRLTPREAKRARLPEPAVTPGVIRMLSSRTAMSTRRRCDSTSLRSSSMLG